MINNRNQNLKNQETYLKKLKFQTSYDISQLLRIVFITITKSRRLLKFISLIKK